MQVYCKHFDMNAELVVVRLPLISGGGGAPTRFFLWLIFLRSEN